MIYAAASLAVVLFLVALERFGVARAAAKAVETSRAAAGTMRDHTLSDLEKERALRRSSVSLIGDFFSVAVRGVGALSASLLTLLAVDLVGLADFGAVMGWLTTWEAVTLVTALAAVWYLVGRRS